MILYRLAIRNLKRNFSNYFVYFVSLVISVFIFFSFSAISSNETILGFSSGNLKIAAAFKVGLSIIGIFISVFIWYSNSFFIKSRSKEIGLYNFLGISKKKISLMVIIESFIFYLVSLGIGIALGILLNKFIIMYLVYFLKIKVYISFSIPFAATLETLKIFSILFFIIGVNSLEIIFNSEIIDLFRYSKKNDTLPKLRVIPGIIGFAMISSAYYIAYTTNINNVLTNFLIDAVLVIVGMFFFYHGLLPLVLILLKRRKKIAYKKLNLIILSNLSSRVKKHGNQMVMITLISSIILASLASAYSFNKIMTNMNSVNGFYSYSFISDKGMYDEILSKVENSEFKLLNKLESEVLVYRPEGEKTDYEDLYIVKLSDYMADMESKGFLDEVHGELDIKDGEFVRILNYMGLSDWDKDDISNEKMNLKYKGKVDYPFGNNILYNDKIIVTDNTFYNYHDELIKRNFYGIKIDHVDLSKELSTEIAFIMPEDKSDNYYFTGLDYEKTYSLLTFIVTFMAFIFMLAIGSVTYFKQLTDMESDKDKFEILRKIGISQRDMKKSIGKQVGFMYFIPIVLAITNTVVALRVLERILGVSVLSQMLLILLFFLGIYIVYYILTLKKYFKVLFQR